MKDDPPVPYQVKPDNRRQFLAGSAAGMGALILGDLLDLPHLHSSLAYGDTLCRLTEEGIAPGPINLSWFSTQNGTISVKMKSRMLLHGPEVVVNIENCVIGVLPGALPPMSSFRNTNPLAISCPFCVAKKVDENQSKDGLELVLHGNLDNAPELAFVLRLRFIAESYGVKFEAEVLSLPPGVKLLALCPDVQYEQFGVQNNPPFEMARQSFIFREGKGFSWIADAQRREAETQTEEGPWIQCFRTNKFAQDRIDVLLRAVKEDFGQLYGRSVRATEDVAACPIAGWVARDNRYMIAAAGKNAYEVGTRWGPCLHSNMAAELDASGNYLPFEARIYILPADMEMLLKMYRDDFADRQNSGLFLPEGTLWPSTQGSLLGSFEGEDLASWGVAGGKLTAYGSDDTLTTRSNEPMRHDVRRRTWVNIIERTDGRHERFTYPEGVTEGKGSALWEVPLGAGEATLTRALTLSEPITHISVDAINRGRSDVELYALIDGGQSRKGSKAFLLHPSSNRRLLVPLREKIGLANAVLVVKMKDHRDPARIVLDNLRIQDGVRFVAFAAGLCSV